MGIGMDIIMGHGEIGKMSPHPQQPQTQQRMEFHHLMMMMRKVRMMKISVMEILSSFVISTRKIS